jgi:acetylornithine/N-succinyldiaminopimelate aminotransferase
LNHDNVNWIEIEKQFLMQTIKRVPITIVRGKGVYIWDEKGKKYLDFVCGLAVNSLGHCHPTIVKAINEQCKKLIQTSNMFYTIPQLKLAKLLVEKSCFNRVFFCNSGTEANEGAIKLARRYGKLNLNGAFEVITTYGSFHGRTLAMVAATGQSKFQEPYIPLPDGFVNVDFNDINAIKKATNNKTCAVLIEPVQGEGGINIPDDDYLKGIREWCTQQNILLIVDEVQTGIGRLGSLFGYELFGIEPDIMTLAKGLGGGVPIGAILAKEKMSVFAPGEHGSTFGGNPLMCATSLAVLEYIINDNIPAKVLGMGKYFLNKLLAIKPKYGFINEVRGMGLLVGIEFNSNIAEKIVLNCFKNGLLINAVKPNMIRFIPPLIIDNKHIDKAVELLEKSLIVE